MQHRDLVGHVPRKHLTSLHGDEILHEAGIVVHGKLLVRCVRLLGPRSAVARTPSGSRSHVVNFGHGEQQNRGAPLGWAMMARGRKAWRSTTVVRNIAATRERDETGREEEREARVSAAL